MLSVKKIYEKDNVARILIKGADTAFVNGIRRTVMNAVPTLAVEDVSVYENSSILFDEFIAQRIGFLPIRTDPKRYKAGEKVTFMLEKEGPGTVYSRDIKSTDPKIEIELKKVPILKIKKGQKIKMEMKAAVGTGREHVKWQPAVISYQELPIITLEKGCNLCDKCVKECPKGVLEVKGKKVTLKDPYMCNLCGNCRDVCDKHAINIDYEKNSFIINIENHGNLKNAQIFSLAAEILDEKNKEFRKILKSI
ncbi:MAG: DNA-directed RNA polymerase subunit D [Candidatus Diapherotrites archaeon]